MPWREGTLSVVRDAFGCAIPVERELIERSSAAGRPGPTGEAARDIAAIWAEVLELPEVSSQDNFFDLGGHSLLIPAVQQKLETRFKRPVSGVDLFRHPTVESLAQLLAGPAPQGLGLVELEHGLEKIWAELLELSDVGRRANFFDLGGHSLLIPKLQLRLKEDFGIVADVWSATSFNELRRDGMEAERRSRLHPTQEPRRSWVQQCLGGREGPVIAASDHMRTFADQIRPFIDARYAVLGTDGFGRSDTRANLRGFFEVDRRHVAVAALHALAQEGTVQPTVVQQAIDTYDIDSEAVPPWRR